MSLLSSITEAKHSPLPNGKATMAKSNGVIQIFYGSGAYDFATLAYPAKQNDDGVKAAEYILTFVGGEKTKKKLKSVKKSQKRALENAVMYAAKLFAIRLKTSKKIEDLQKVLFGLV